MKMKLTISVLFVSLFTFGQTNNVVRQSKNMFKNTSELTLLDSISINEIVGCYTFNLVGMIGSTCKFDTTMHFRVTSFAEAYSNADSGTWQILNKNILRFQSFKRVHSNYIIKFDRYYFLIPTNQKSKFISDFTKASLRVDEKQKSNSGQEQKSRNSMIADELIGSYEIRDVLKTCT